MKLENTRLLLPALLAVALLAGCEPNKTVDTPGNAQSAQAGALLQETETARLNQWFDARYEEELQFSPIQLSYLGRKALYGQIDDMSEAAEERQLAWQATTVEALKHSFDRTKLSLEGKTSYDVWVYQYEQAKAAAPFKRHSYIFEQMGGAQAQLPQFLINIHRVDDESDMVAYIARIGGLGRAVEQLLVRAKMAAAEGIRPPRFAFEGAIDQSSKVITGKPFTESDQDSALWADSQSKVDALVQAGTIDAAKGDSLKAQANKALKEQFMPAYQALIAWLQADMANTTAEPQGAGSLPNGEAYYKQRLAKTTTTNMSPEEIHQLGLSEVARIRTEMETVKASVGFEGSLQDFFAFVRTDAKFFYPNTDAGRQGYLDQSKAFLDAITAKLPQYFGLLPKAELVVKRVEAFRERDGGAQHYVSGTPDGSRPGVYYAHLSDMGAYSTTDMETTAYHEGLPGHHMQISIAQERTDIPQFRTQAHFTVYSEGWALYAERLAREMGAFEDPYKLFGHLTAEMWRAIRLVVDTGLHAKGWSEEQAVQYFLANSAIPETAVRSEVRRYLVWPGQATAYKIGMLKIFELREKAKAELGDKFDIKGFHDTVLGGGALPMPVLERRVGEWVAAVKTQA